ncbi:3'(2'),5'-bisphosphate nucleotidase CysQ [Aeromonas simiae]|uniref:3'(2'),5'-bisphosphate nucleotidase CysQ n=1 Tax=Aeromonas simiae TaxID=218936 RepID=UPI0005A6B11A|nr:3'(2'),5'-bisphosphate nucleotidase CysQ [Aeromonas simiae]MDO2949560.1 3'(2'),5'-bisphosphate nucleotidase CysQ [Aeromonas simiae]MDO2953262.1 3'(2'),5'-bisphosphate nucleotidase CysQ [Aeromonas simiae]MDO2956891.1 3'(2'),5'-bisphosphate nucleotidase CysQ [Aeromonas simiae]
MIDLLAVAPEARRIAREAGRILSEIYRSGQFERHQKEDDTPVTSADLAADAYLKQALSALTPGVPVLTEEAADIPLAQRVEWPEYWLVDPLDGTGEFIAGSGDFATLIALVRHHHPVLGIVYAPESDVLYWAVQGHGAFKECGGEQYAIAAMRHEVAPASLVVAISRRQKIERLTRRLNPDFHYDLLPLGSSSLKSCLVAEGAADCYVRLGPTGEWDTAAAQCIVEEAGGRILNLGLQPLSYNRRESLENPDFITLGDPSLAWERILRP